ncbi:HutD/Ves family protein [Clostridium aminobutyricum]|uniref:HutD family protein n=1 Tax=Clostridium aminobutyricum TaxID=33953 RepID=A0A939DA59_CLOAM|nr:HutD family protein [Clostridium aminobutyricum]MBN7773991.1 HutD family protein [Clostridium aminobutyricum]
MNNIDFKIYKNEDYNTEKWMGGTTTELSIYPKEAKYSDRKFVWRLSSATIDVEESNFTKLPEYDRILIVLENEVVLVHKDERAIRLAQYEQDRFDGNYDTVSFGKITDYNLMVRKGNEGMAEVLSLTPSNTFIKLEKAISYQHISETYYCLEGYCAVTFGKNTCLIRKGDLLVIHYPAGELESIGVMGEGKAIRAYIHFNEEAVKEEREAEIAAPQESNFRDILDAAKVCYTNFRGSKYIFKSRRTLWYDEQLKNSLDRLERTFLPFFVFLVGMAVAAAVSMELLDRQHFAELFLLWLAIDLILVNPLLYFFALPKPIAAHIKKLDSLTEEEKAIYEKQKSENKRLNRLLKKYEITGRNVHKDE